MNLTEEQKQEILRLHSLGKSQNVIASITRISKPYVNYVINQHADNALNGLPQLQVKQTPITSNFRNSEAEFYANKRIDDLETIKAEQRKLISDLTTKLETLQREYNTLKLDFDTQEKKHEYDKNMLVATHNFNKTQGLSGFADKIFSNEKAMELGVLLLSRLAGNNQQSPPMVNAQVMEQHPLSTNPEYGKKVSEILQVLNSITETSDIDALYVLFGVFATVPGTVQALSNLFTANPSITDIEAAKRLFEMFSENQGLLQAVTTKTEKFLQDKQTNTPQ